MQAGEIPRKLTRRPGPRPTNEEWYEDKLKTLSGLNEVSKTAGWGNYCRQRVSTTRA